VKGGQGSTVQENIASMPVFAGYAQHHEDQLDRDRKTIGALREKTEDCPACIFAALRQADYWQDDSIFNFKAECKKALDYYASEHQSGPGYGDY
jgi:hypothetical protein